MKLSDITISGNLSCTKMRILAQAVGSTYNEYDRETPNRKFKFKTMKSILNIHSENSHKIFENLAFMNDQGLLDVDFAILLSAKDGQGFPMFRIEQ